MELPPPGPVKKKPGISSFVKGGVGLLATSTVDMTVSFSTSYWATWKKAEAGEHGGYGLWKIWRCEGGRVYSNEEVTKETPGCVERFADISSPDWYVATQVLESLGLAGLLAALIMLLLYMFLPQWEKNKAAMSSIIAISYLSGLFIMVGLFVFGFKVAEEIQEKHPSEWFLSWSFSLACTAFVLNQIAASILVTENKRLYCPEDSTEQNTPLVQGISDELQHVWSQRT